MKKIALLLIIFIATINGYSQCTDIWGKAVKCPSQDDSMIIYNNSLNVYSFYENNKSYTKISQDYIKSDSDKVVIFRKMLKARREYAEMILQHEKYIKENKLLTGLSDLPMNQYYNVVDVWRYYQRELEYKIINDDAPFPLYDNRISPITVCTYKNTNPTSEFYNDEVNIPMYIPVTVKPYAMLTESERNERAEILKKIEKVKNKVEFERKLLLPTRPSTIIVPDLTKPASPPVVKRPDTIIQKIDTIKITINPYEEVYKPIPYFAVPIYYYNDWGAGVLMGHMIGRKFRKYSPNDQYYEFLPKAVKELLNDDERVNEILRLYYGGYYDGLYK